MPRTDRGPSETNGGVPDHGPAAPDDDGPLEEQDLVIVGGGPAGLTAGLYGARALLRTLILDDGPPGGQLLRIDIIDDYPGIQRIPGPELAAQIAGHAFSFGARFRPVGVDKIVVDDSTFVIRTSETPQYRCGAVIVCTGGRPRRLGVPGEQELEGRGVSYCAVCDGPFFRRKRVLIAGSGNSAAEEAVYLTRFADSVHMVVITPEMTADPVLQKRVLANPKISVLYNTAVEEIGGTGRVEWVRLRDVSSAGEETLEAGGVFIYVGFEPQTEVFPAGIETDAAGFVVTDCHQQTAVPGLFVAGDIHSHPVRHITNATADGTVAALFAYQHLKSLEDKGLWDVHGIETP